MRIRKIQGQLTALSSSIEAEDDCYKVMQIMASCRGAFNGLMSEIVTGHIKGHIVQADSKQEAAQAGDELIAVMESFLK